MCKTIKQKVHFKAPPDVIFSLWRTVQLGSDKELFGEAGIWRTERDSNS